jgi:hypothetical protein
MELCTYTKALEQYFRVGHDSAFVLFSPSHAVPMQSLDAPVTYCNSRGNNIRNITV